jgi:hypothetical protein
MASNEAWINAAASIGYTGEPEELRPQSWNASPLAEEIDCAREGIWLLFLEFRAEMREAI